MLKIFLLISCCALLCNAQDLEVQNLEKQRDATENDSQRARIEYEISEVWEKRMQKVYGEFLATLTPDVKNKVEAVHKLWLEYVESESNTIGSEKENMGGTVYQYMAAEFYAEEMKRRFEYYSQLLKADKTPKYTLQQLQEYNAKWDKILNSNYKERMSELSQRSKDEGEGCLEQRKMEKATQRVWVTYKEASIALEDALSADEGLAAVRKAYISAKLTQDKVNAGAFDRLKEDLE